MQKRFYLPLNEYYRWKWYMNFAAELPGLAELLGISRANADTIVANSLALNFVMLYLEALRKNDSLWMAAKDGLFLGKNVEPGNKVNFPNGPELPTTPPAAVDPKIFDLAIALGDSIVNSLNSTPQILQTLKLVPPSESGIEVPDDRRRPTRPANGRPRVRVTASGATVTGEITRGKGLLNTNAWVYSNLTSGDEYTFLTSTNGTSFTETLHFEPGIDRITVSYIVQLVDKDNKLIGQASEPFTITVMRPLGT